MCKRCDELIEAHKNGESISQLDKVVEAGARWHGDQCDAIWMVYPEREYSPFAGLLDMESARNIPVNRGIHESYIGSQEFVSVFYNGLGWADIGAEFYREICEKFSLPQRQGRPTDLAE